MQLFCTAIFIFINYYYYPTRHASGDGRGLSLELAPDLDRSGPSRRDKRNLWPHLVRQGRLHHQDDGSLFDRRTQAVLQEGADQLPERIVSCLAGFKSKVSTKPNVLFAANSRLLSRMTCGATWRRRRTRRAPCPKMSLSRTSWTHGLFKWDIQSLTLRGTTTRDTLQSRRLLFIRDYTNDNSNFATYNWNRTAF